jgi:hypothetical protein
VVCLQSQSGHEVEEKKSRHCPCQELNPANRGRNLISIPTELPRFNIKKTTVKFRNTTKNKKGKKKWDSDFTIYPL